MDAEGLDIINEDEDVWWMNQLYLLTAGVVCGIVTASVLLRRDQNRDMGNRSTSLHHLASTLSTNNKMVLIINTELGMAKGKVASQCAHAAVACYKKASKRQPQFLKQWEMFGQAKITLKADNAQMLNDLKKQAEALGLTACIIHDAGRTQVEAGVATVLGIGPAPVSLLDPITGSLKLY